MGLELVEDHHEPHSTPKLSLSKPPFKRSKQPSQMLTPPFHPSLSVPFGWEEEPGKPRATMREEAPPSPVGSISKKKAAASRSLDLPPRLLLDNDAKITKMFSPTNVLDGPYAGETTSVACTFSFRKGPFAAQIDGSRPKKRRGAGNLGSRRWDSFKVDETFDEGGFDFSLKDVLKREKRMQSITNRRKGFCSLSNIHSNLWTDIYKSFKQAVSWRSRT